MRYQLNFSETALTESKRKTILIMGSVVYISICLFSLILLYQTYESRSFIADVFDNRAYKLREKISELEPRILYLENKSAERNRISKQISLYTQENHRPSTWYTRLFDLSSILPANAVLTKISFNPHQEEWENLSEISIDGFLRIKGKEEDITPLENYRISLSESLPFNFNYPYLQVDSSSFIQDRNNIKLLFSLGFYR